MSWRALGHPSTLSGWKTVMTDDCAKARGSDIESLRSLGFWEHDKEVCSVP
jgi:hypothetical protein